MKLFRHANRDRTEETRRVYAAYELIYTGVDFLAAFSFLVGSVLFFWEKTQFAGTWLFVGGSILFMLKPSIRLVREIRLYRMGQVDRLAERAEE